MLSERFSLPKESIISYENYDYEAYNAEVISLLIQKRGVISSFLRRIERRICSDTFSMVKAFNLYVDIKTKKFFFHKVLKKLNPNFVVIFEDGVGSSVEFINACINAKKIVALCPYEISQKKDVKNFVFSNLSHLEAENHSSKIVQYLTKRLFSGWLCEFNGRLVSPISLEHIVALRLNGINIPQPWVPNGGQATFIAVEGKRIKELYLEDGVPLKKLISLGSAYFDKIAKLRAEKTNSSASKNLRRKVLISIPPDLSKQYGQGSFGSFHKCIVDLVKQIHENTEMDCVLSLHPDIEKEDRKEIRRLNVKFSDKPILEEIVSCDICISFYSSTIRWFLAFGVPVINIDCWDLKLNLYDDAIGFYNSRSAEDFKRNLGKLSNQVEYSIIKSAMQDVSSEWCQPTTSFVTDLRTYIEKISYSRG